MKENVPSSAMDVRWRIHSESAEGGIKRAHTTHTTYWLHVEFILLKWSVRP